MNLFVRPLAGMARPRLTRLLAVAAVALAGSAGTLALQAAPASAVVSEEEGPKVGLQPRNATTIGTPGETPETFANASGNAVLHGTDEYVVYWDPNRQFHHEWVSNIDGFFAAMGSLGEEALDTGFSVLGQYRDASNASAPFRATFRGAYSDTSKFPAPGCSDAGALEKGAVTCLTDAQLRTQLQEFITARGLPTGMGIVYFLLTPPGVTVCLGAAGGHCSDYELSASEAEKEERKSLSYKQSFCSYHSDINPDGAPEGDGATILYAAVPWTAGYTGLAGGRYVTKGEEHSYPYENAFDCQDGGWNPEKHQEVREHEREVSEKENEAYEKMTGGEQHKFMEELFLERPHVEEPNQGNDEEGDAAAGLSDVLINQIAEEEYNTVTDPLLDGWQDGAHNEVSDMCRNAFASTVGPEGGKIEGSVKVNPESGTYAGTLSNVSVGPDRYYLNNVFSAADGSCAGGVGLTARFTAPNPVSYNQIVSVDGMESTVGLWKGDAFSGAGTSPTTTYAQFRWNFGDGSPEVEGFAPGAPTCEQPWLSPCAASALHTYQYGGKYTITLTITDVAGNTTSTHHEITVVGPSAPTAGAGAGSSSAPGTPGSSAPGSASSSGAGSHPRVAPSAAAAVLTRSVHAAIHAGLLVSYSVSEQVAGRFEVMMGAALARRLHIQGRRATGLAAGSAPQIVIGNGLLVTTAGGRNAVRLHFGSRTDARLAHVHNINLLLRLTVHAAGSPTPTTLVSAFTLGR